MTKGVQGLKKSIIAVVTGFTVAAGILSGGITGRLGGGQQVQAAEVACTTYTGDNIEDQNYEYSQWAKPIRSYLTYENGTYMRVQAGADANGYVVEYFDSSFTITGRKIVPQELPLFGGFYEMNGNYYILSGQTNKNESDSVEVYRITKYTKDWNRVASCGLYGANTTVPFDAGSARMAAYGNYLMIRTSHEMYAIDGVNHQANVTIQVDTSTMKITDSFTKVMNINYGYVSHSFNQFIQMENGKIVAVDHGDANPRSIVLVRYPSVVTSSGFTRGISYSSACKATDIVAFEGTKGANYTGATVGGFEISDTAYLTAGSVDIDSTAKYSAGQDIFVGVVSKSTDAVTVNKITNYTAGQGTTDTPQFVKIGTNSYMLLWHRGSSVYYTKIDGNGNQVGAIYSLAGDLSDCVPVLAGDKLVWYTWKNEILQFYQININDLSDYTVKNVVLGHSYQVSATNASDASVVLTCSKCGQSHTEYVVKSFAVYWYGSADNGYYYTNYESRYDTGTKLKFLLRNQTYSSESDSTNQNSEMVWESSDTSIATVSNLTDESGTVNMLKPGIVKISIYPKYNPSCKKATTFRIGKEGEVSLDDCQISLSQDQYVYDGSSKKPVVTVAYKGQDLIQNTDYTVTYTNDTGVGDAVVTVTGKGIFAGSKNLNYIIEAIDIGSYKLEIQPDSYIYDGTEKEPEVKVVISETTGNKYYLDASNYTVKYENNKNAGTANVTVTGTGNYSGELKGTFIISQKDITGANVTIPQESYEYTGTEIKPEVTVTLSDGTGLIFGTDYTVSYEDNTDIGTATVNVIGRGNYTGKANGSFGIGADIKDAEIVLSMDQYIYSGRRNTPKATVVFAGKTLVENVDYTISYEDCIDAGTARVVVSGKGNYGGTAEKTFEIARKGITGANVTIPQECYEYISKEIRPEATVTLSDGTVLKNAIEYIVDYTDNIEVGTATITVTGTGNYIGYVTKTFTIIEAKKDDGSETKPGDGSETKPGDGSETKPGDGSETKPGDGSETKPGDGSETKPGDGGKTEPVDVPAIITVNKTTISKVENKATGVKLTWKKVSDATGYVVYRKNSGSKSWKKIKIVKGASKTTYTDSTVKSKHGTVYSYRIESYKSVNGQTAKAVSKEKKILRLTAPTKLKIANQKGRKLSVTWKKQKKISGYQIQYSTGKTFAKGTKMTNIVKSSDKAVIKKLKKGKTYYVRIRSYQKSGSKKTYSAWSSYTKVKIKK
ncbi:fibronectin type III domain-containing protein [Clostridium sp. L2-50]|uniref:fibronectin type III domain-containing protein n=1 Tax=Clostridium sp. L2-50 TaxID=411489 RepID=UPI00015BC7A2|nr:fibronectin type III domain-containing protein [Clostridium sp. L2-50]EDO58318.1 fibronectin type III domain protein [Clostridium sp. L2-50]UEA74178.1 fibronectin type III domain-containing protein [Lachnospiraceae bacterium GAM79]UEA77374.1 fibronectin type III domain-containing protein [Lachnospiraceae bacterium GAM79]